MKVRYQNVKKKLTNASYNDYDFILKRLEADTLRGTFWQLKAYLANLLPRKWIFYHGHKRSNKIALTFDDGPHPQYTLEVLKILSEYEIKASFFFIGKHIQQYPDIIQKVHAAGHLIGGHGYNHTSAHALSSRQFLDELNKTQLILQQTIGINHLYFRPPYGHLKLSTLKSCISLGIPIVLWSVDSRDFEQKGEQHIIDNVNNANIRAGDILLFHDNNQTTPRALRQIITQLRQTNYQFVCIDAL